MLGDYSGSTHLQGEVLGTMLDLIIRDATNGKRSIDDIMKKMMENFSGEKGFTSKDIERIIQEACGCDVHQFFQDHIFGNKQIDFNKYLRLAGLQMEYTWKDVLSEDGKPAPDLRVYAWQEKNENLIRLGITNPQSCWGKAGLRTKDIIRSINGAILKTQEDLRRLIRNVKVGDTVVMEIQRLSDKRKVNVLITGYQQPNVSITPFDKATEKQKKIFTQWINNGGF
jgi:predicted metalloprotease with PDZ domain